MAEVVVRLLVDGDGVVDDARLLGSGADGMAVRWAPLLTVATRAMWRGLNSIVADTPPPGALSRVRVLGRSYKPLGEEEL